MVAVVVAVAVIVIVVDGGGSGGGVLPAVLSLMKSYSECGG